MFFTKMQDAAHAEGGGRAAGAFTPAAGSATSKDAAGRAGQEPAG